MRVVQKFGGSSVADAASIKRVAQRIVDTKARGAEVVVVISAMGDTTDELMDLALQVSPQPRPRELDMLLAVAAAALLFSTTQASYCGPSMVPYSLEVLPSGALVLGCARPVCFGWQPSGAPYAAAGAAPYAAVCAGAT